METRGIRFVLLLMSWCFVISALSLHLMEYDRVLDGLLGGIGVGFFVFEEMIEVIFDAG